MEYEHLQRKKQFNDSPDLFGLTYSYKNKLVEIESFLICDQFTVGRPDLIAFIKWNKPQWGPLLCKINGITSPHKLKEGTQLVIPTEKFMKSCEITPKTEDNINLEISNNFTDIIKSKINKIVSNPVQNNKNINPIQITEQNLII